jgi:hypothetical protein
MQGIEAMFDAMQFLEGHQPHDLSRIRRNPINLEGSPFPHTAGVGPILEFADIITGTQAGIFELKGKIMGHNSHGITPESTLNQLYDVYAPRGDGDNNPNAYALFVATWCTTALGRTVTAETKLRDVCPELFTGGTSS